MRARFVSGTTRKDRLARKPLIRSVSKELMRNQKEKERMPRLTITLSEERHRALKEAAAQRGKTIQQLVEESLDFYGIKTTEKAAALVAKARKRTGLGEESALRLAVEETRAERRG